MQHIGAILDHLTGNPRLAQGLSNYSFFADWEQVVGAHLAERTRPLRVDGQVLLVYVDDATLRHHMTFLLPKMLQKIRQHAPSARISTIRFTMNPEA